MGSFSWMKADKLTKVANIAYDAPFKMLIPKEFGGGFIKDKYQDYGRIGQKENGEPKYDMFELLAFWNADMPQRYSSKGVTVRADLLYDGEFPLLKEIDQYTQENRSLGIGIGTSANSINILKYPLKLVSCSYKGTYEDCEGRSYGDPYQGSSITYR